MRTAFPRIGVLLVCALALPAIGGCAERVQRLEFRATTIRVGSQPNDVAIGDVDGDRNGDLVVANVGSRDVSVLLGDGRGGFRPARGSPVAVPIAAHLVALGDFDRDAKTDLAVTEHDGNDVLVLRGDGRGGFAPMPGSPFRLIEGVPPHNHGIAAADVDGDGVLDLASSNNSGNSVSVLRGDGRGGFRPFAGSPFPVGRAPYPLAVADLDGDGDADVATPDVNGHTVSVLLGNGRGAFSAAPGSPHRVGERPYFATAADLDGDRAADLVVSHDDGDRLTILLNRGRGRFGAPKTTDVGGRTWKVRVADADGDGRTDLLMGRAPSSVAILLGDGNGGFRPAPGSPFPTGPGPWGIAVGELNGDGRIDVVTTATEGGAVSILLSQAR